MTTTHARDDARPRSTGGGSRWLVLWLLAAAQLMLVLDVTVVNVALPDIGADLALPRSVIPWVMTTYTLVFGGLMLLGGRIADRVGPRRMMLTGLTIFTTASLACAVADSATVLLAGRAVQGVGAALLSPAALGLVTTTFTGAERGRALGIWGGLSAGGAALGVTLGGILTTTLGWQWIFAINIPIGVLILAILPFLVRASSGTSDGAGLDLPGAILVTLGTAGVIYGLVNAGSHGWASLSTVVPAGVGLVLWALFALVERATRVPLLRLSLLGERPVAAGAFLMLVATALMVGEFFIGSFALQRAYGYTALTVGLMFLPVAVAIGAGAHLAGRLLSRISARTVAVGGLVLAAAGQASAATTNSAVTLVAGLAVAAFGIGASFVTAFTAALATADAPTAGLRSAIVSTFHELGGAFGVAVLSTVAGTALAAARPAPGDFTNVFVLAAVVAGVGALIALILVPPVVRPQAEGALAPAHGHP